jgi:hypothetical protein
MAITIGGGPVVDVAPLPGGQSETAVAINPTNPNNVVIVADNNAGKGLVESYSFDDGQTWTHQVLADGTGTAVPAAGQPSLSWDKYGNLFLGYLDDSKTGAVVALSVDGGKSFDCLTTVTNPQAHQNGQTIPPVDRPRITSGAGSGGFPGSVWITFESLIPQLQTGDPTQANKTEMIVWGAGVSGLNQVGDFKFDVIQNSTSGNFADIAVEPNGSVVMAYQAPTDDAGASQIFATIDANGLAGTFAAPFFVTGTNIGGLDDIPPQKVATIDAEVGFAVDTAATSPHFGRLYMIYTDAPSIRCGATDVYLRYSDDGGATWSNRVKVNDDPGETGANFLPRIALDPTTGNIGVSFLSARNDPGFGPGDRDGLANTDVEEFATMGYYLNGNLTFTPNVQIAAAPSNAAIANHNNGADFGRYTGLAFDNGTMFPAWPDNSSTLVGNPDPNNFDIATSRVTTVFLSATGVHASGTINVPFGGVVANFQDSDIDASMRTANDYATSIDWGDGTVTPGFVTPLGNNQYTVSGVHTYVNAKKYVVKTTITDTVDGRSIIASSTIAVEGVDIPNPFAASLVAGPVVDTNRQQGNQSEEAIAINPTNPQNIVVLSNQNADVPTQIGALPMVESYSFDGGTTWTTRNITDGYGVLVPGFGDPSIAFDQFGNLFICSLDSTKELAAVALSTDGGITFHSLATFEAAPHARNVGDQPKIAVGPGTTSPGSLWLSFEAKDNSIKAVGAPVYGLGLVGPFGPQEDVPGSTGGNFGSIAVGPNGQVIVNYQVPVSDQGPSTIFANLDPDGLGGAGFGAAVPVSTTNVGGFLPIPAQAVRTIDAGLGIAYDVSNDSHNGRVYVVYTDSIALLSPSTNIYVRYSDDDGATWSAPVKVNDDNTDRSHFFPKIAVDPVTGYVAVSWYDARNDPGFGPGDRDGQPNDDVEVYAAVSTNGGVSFSPNIQVQSHPSEAAIANHNNGNDFGDYTGLAFYNGVFFPAWADNSVGLAGNPDPNNFDIAVARVGVNFNIPITGMPSPFSITGVLNGNKVTNNNRPTFIGTTEPGAVVSLFVEPNGQGPPILVGTTIANAQGAWTITTLPLPDGNYSVFVSAVDVLGHTSPLVQILPGNGMGQLIIDTQGPKVTGLVFDPVHGKIIVTFQDERSGLNQASLANPANYILTQNSKPRKQFVVTNIQVSPQLSPILPQTVVLTFNNGAPLRGLDFRLDIVAGGIRDLATNPLNGEFFGYFPSGGPIMGLDFIARLDSIHNTIFPAEPLTPPAVAIRAHQGHGAHRNHVASVVTQPTAHDVALASLALEGRHRKRG